VSLTLILKKKKKKNFFFLSSGLLHKTTREKCGLKKKPNEGEMNSKWANKIHQIWKREINWV